MMTENEDRAARNMQAMIKRSGKSAVYISNATGLSCEAVRRYRRLMQKPDVNTVMKVCDGMGWDFDCVIGVGKAPNEAPAENIQENIAELMRQSGDTARSLADEIGVNAGRVYTWLNGRFMPRLDPFVSMCLHWKVTPSSMIGRKR